MEGKMTKFKLSLILVIATAFSIPALAADTVVKRVPAGAVAFHFVYDLTLVPPPGELVGYIAFIEGVDSSLFNGLPSKDTAHFTVRVTQPLPPPSPLPVERDPALVALLFPPGGQFTVFYDAEPTSRDWSDPDTFSRGVPIAVFDESALLNTMAFGPFPGIGMNVFSSKLVESTAINFNGQKLDFNRMVPYGVTITNFGNAGRPDNLGAAGGGTAISIGGNVR
jgi:hypothetical protein